MLRAILAAFLVLACLPGVSCPLLFAAEAGFRVVDPNGQPIPQFEQMVYPGSGTKPTWTRRTEGNGQIVLSDPLPPAIHVLVRAEGYSAALASYEGNAREAVANGAATIVLHPGKEIVLEFKAPDGMKLPDDLLPYTFSSDVAPYGVFPWDHGTGAPTDHDRDLLAMQKAGDGRFKLRMSESHPKFGVTIYHPGFLRYFEAGPFDSSDIKDGVLTVPLPRPASLTVSLSTERLRGIEVPFSKAHVSTEWSKGRSTLFVPLLGKSVATLDRPTIITDLAPGSFRFLLRTTSKSSSMVSARLEASSGDIPDPGLFRDQREVRLEDGQHSDVAFEYIPFDPQAFVGEYEARLKVLTPTGKPAAGREVKVTYFDSYYGGLTAYEGLVPEDGVLRLKRLTDKVIGAKVTRPFTIACGTDSLGGFKVTADGPNEYEFRLAPVAGDEAPDIEFSQVADGIKHRLSEYRGRIVVLEFWATWCGPCQKPLANLNREAKDRGDAWRDQVVILPLSIDKEISVVAPHVQKAGWDNLSVVWATGETNSPSLSAADAYGLKSVPTSVLIGRDGVIIWRGHASAQFGGAELADRIDAALKGEPQAPDPSR
ncbi:MAG TPA: TlpA disulfide reductase family protein [Caulifigura sp.]|nr:TlpA disulfide reductase family protein [Caulifigura sp.]